MLTKSYSCFSAFLLCAVIFVLAGCSGSGSSGASASQNGQGAISAKLVWSESGSKTTAKSVASAPVGVTTVRLAISGVGMTTIQQDFPVAAGSGTLYGIPAGSGLTVTATGLDASGAITHQGAAESVTVQNGQTTDVGTITMLSVGTTTGVTSAMISGKTFTHSNSSGNTGTITFNTDGTFSATGADGGVSSAAWSINPSGQLILTASTETDTMSLTSVSATTMIFESIEVEVNSPARNVTVTFTQQAISPTPWYWSGNTLYGQPGNGSATVSGTDIKSVTFSSDANNLYWTMELYGTPNTDYLSTNPLEYRGYTVEIEKANGDIIENRVLLQSGIWKSALATKVAGGSFTTFGSLVNTTAINGIIPLSLLDSGDIRLFPFVSAYFYLGGDAGTVGIGGANPLTKNLVLSVISGKTIYWADQGGYGYFRFMADGKFYGTGNLNNGEMENGPGTYTVDDRGVVRYQIPAYGSGATTFISDFPTSSAWRVQLESGTNELWFYGANAAADAEGLYLFMNP